MPHYEQSSRSLVKTLTYRAFVIVFNAILIFILTKDYKLAFNLSLIIAVANTVLYFAHERIWNHVHWGKQRTS